MPYSTNPNRPINLKMRRFVEAYTGDGQAAAIAAGYSPKSAKVTASDLLQDARVIAAIDERAQKSAAPLIRSRLVRQEWLVKVIEDAGEEMKERLKAMEILKRSCGDFLDRVEVMSHHTVSLPDVDAETMRIWARKTLPKVEPEEEEEAEIVGPH